MAHVRLMARLSTVLSIATGCSGAWGSCLEERHVWRGHPEWSIVRGWGTVDSGWVLNFHDNLCLTQNMCLLVTHT